MRAAFGGLPLKMLEETHRYKGGLWRDEVGKSVRFPHRGRRVQHSKAMTLMLIQHRCRQFHCLFALAAKHTGNLLAPGFAGHLSEPGEGATASDFFCYHKLRRCRRRHRRQMRDTKHLMPLCQFTHPSANSVSNFAAD